MNASTTSPSPAQLTPELLREAREAAKRIRELCGMVNRFSAELGRGKKVDADAWAEDFEAALAKATGQNS